MEATELFLKDGKSEGIYFCGKCKIVAHNKESAENCCQNYHCDKCGQDTGSRSYTRCGACRVIDDAAKERERFEKAEKVAEWPGWVYSDIQGGNDGFFENVEDYLDRHYDSGELDMPNYVWACSENHFVHADIEDITSAMEGEAYEDFDANTLNGLDELKAALDNFNEANKDVASYEPDYSKAVLIKKQS